MSTPPPAIYDLECFSGVDFEFTFSMTGADEQPISFAGCSAWLTVFDDQEKKIEVAKLSISNGKITLIEGDIKLVAKYPAIDTASLPVDGHIYDFDVEFSDGKRWRIFTGRFTVIAGNLA